MLAPASPLAALAAALADGSATPFTVAEMTLARANRGASHNTYQWLDWEWLLREAQALVARGNAGQDSPLWGIPISVKDCFDLAGAATSCGSRFYAERPVAGQDSAIVQRLRSAGALITGKTHLHPLAYGITGENPEYSDCVQPRDGSLLTGGSSSGAAASVQEGSALVGIGTDTGGSIRVPAALCGLVGYRASHWSAYGTAEGLWAGGAHLAPSFDTLGFLVEDPRDVRPVAQALFSVPASPTRAVRVGWVGGELLAQCELEVRRAFDVWRTLIADVATPAGCEPGFWGDSTEIFSGIQAHEAAELHAGHFDAFEPAIRDRLRWGASLGASVIDGLRARLRTFQARMDELFVRFDLLMLPASPVSRLAAGSDLSEARGRILRYTTPFSLAGLPALSLPGELAGAPFGTGVQIAAKAGGDAMLVSFADSVGASLARKDVRG